MSNACAFRRVCFAATALIAVWICSGQYAAGQTPLGNIAPNGLLSLLGTAPSSNPAASYPQPMVVPHRAPLARLIENPDQTNGAPPFALTDQNGTVQRYVEPVPGIDLGAYVGQVVAVRHDTGPTLLASQLELPARPLYPRVTRSDDGRYAAPASALPKLSRGGSTGVIEQVQYVDNDDASVQLLPDDVSISDGNPAAAGRVMPLQTMPSGGEYPVFTDQMGPPAMEGPAFGQPFGPTPYGPGGMMTYPNQMIGPCPNCGRYHNGMGYGNNPGCGQPCNECQPNPNRARLSADFELSLLRPQINENAIGKLSEEYQVSPRVILAFQGVGNLDGRVRFWHYDRNTDLLGSDDDVEIRFDVLDIEALHRFAGCRSQLIVAAGVRLAGIHLRDSEDDKSNADLIGAMLAADGLTPLVDFPRGHFGWVYGGRLSILGGDWRGDDSDFVDGQVRNDNLLVHELYGGVELACRVRAIDLHARLLFEMQNWKSDVLAEGADIESIGIFGPGLQLGADF